jgi:hypothetical protein
MSVPEEIKQPITVENVGPPSASFRYKNTGWSNALTGELWVSDGNAWYEITAGGGGGSSAVASGTVTIPQGQTSASALTGLTSPQIISIAPSQDLEGARWWESSDATHITVNIDAVADSDMAFNWFAIDALAGGGSPGPQGPQGPQGTGAGINWRGTYGNSTSYVPGDGVSSGGSLYVCIASTTGNTPPNATYWNLFTGTAGPQGIQGPQGTQGPGGLTGAQGIQGPRGAQGPQGAPAGTTVQGTQAGDFPEYDGVQWGIDNVANISGGGGGSPAPLGHVMPFFRPTTATPIPTGYVIAQGQTLTAGQHDWGAQPVTLPDLRGSVIVGAGPQQTFGAPGTPGNPPGETGAGGDSSTRALAHTHAVDIAQFNTGSQAAGSAGSTGSAGAATVTSGASSSSNTGTTNATGTTSAQSASTTGVSAGNPTSFKCATAPHTHSFDDGGHSHGMAHTHQVGVPNHAHSIPAAPPHTHTVNPPSTTSGSSLGAVDIRMAYVGLLILIKIRSG